MGSINEIIEDIGSRIGYSEEVLDRAKEMCEEYTEGGTEGEGLFDVVGASVVVAGWEKKMPYPYKKILGISDKIGTGMAKHVKHLKDRYNVESPSPVDYVDIISDRLGLENKERERALDVARATLGRYIGSSPPNIAAAAVYQAGRDHLTRKEVVDAAGVSKVSLHNAYKNIVKAREEGVIEDGIKIMTPEGQVSLISDKLGIKESERERALDIAESARNNVVGCFPETIAAAAVYYSTGEEYTGEKVADSAGVSRPSIRNAYERIAQAEPSIAAERLIDYVEESVGTAGKPKDRRLTFTESGWYLNSSSKYPSAGIYQKVFGSLEEAFEFAGFADFEAVDLREVSKGLTEEDYIYKILTDLELDESYAEEALGLLESAKGSLPAGEDLPGTPQSRAASAVYIVSDGLSQREVASPVGYTKHPVSKHYRDIAELAGLDLQGA